LSLLCVLLLGACAAALVAESSRRRTIARLAGPSLAALPPAVVATAGIVEDGDGAALILAEGLLDSGGAAPGGLAAAREIVLETAVRRPGSAHARLLLGRAAAPGAATAFWKTPLELASEAAPGLDPAASALGGRYLAVWEKLSPEERREGETALTRAFLDPSFLRAGFSLALQRLGPETAVRLVPEDPSALEAASRIATATGSRRASELLSERRKSESPAAASRPAP
jgi:hypothetical protein